MVLRWRTARVGIPPTVPVRVRGPHAELIIDALIDTGSTFCAVAPEEARLLGFKTRGQKIGIETGGGRQRARLLVLNQVSLLGVRHEGVETLVIPFPKVAVRAIIGWTFLRYHDFGFDKAKGRFRIRG